MTATNGHVTSTTQGRIVQVIGPVVDVEFAGGDLPEINTALKISNPSISDKNKLVGVREQTILFRSSTTSRP